MSSIDNSSTKGSVWQTRLSRDAAASYEEDIKILGIDRSEALRRGLRLLHREAVETRMAMDVEQFYGGELAPLSEVTAKAYGPTSGGRGDRHSGAATR